MFIGILAGTAAAQQTTITSKDGGQMVLVPAGAFIMGSGEGKEEETPPHVLNLPAFYMDKTEVTNAMFARFLAEAGGDPPLNWGGASPPAKTENFPVTNVTWFEAMRYAAWAGKRLPTESEWEKAARGADGRRFPWGNADAFEVRNIDSAEGVHPVGQTPRGASPYGCLDMAGNVWEWVADWYQAYPGTTARSSHFGRHFKVLRGGGAIHFYGVENSPRCSMRGRLVPYGDYDAVGFRCALDVDPAKAPYTPQLMLDEAKQQLASTLKPAVTLDYEKEYADYLKARRVPVKVVGQPGQKGVVRSGVPFPQSLLKDTRTIVARTRDGVALPTQTYVLAPWKDGSPRWVLVDFPATAGESYELSFGEAEPPSANPAVKVARAGQNVTIDTGAITALITPEALLKEVRRDGAVAASPMTLRMKVLDSQGEPKELRPMPAEKIEVEEEGPLHAVVRVRGGMTGPQAQSAFRYDLRIHATAGSPRLNLLLTLTNFSKRIETKQQEEKPAPIVRVAAATVSIDLPQPITQLAVGGDRGSQTLQPAERVELLQPNDLVYTITQGSKKVGGGTRAAGWISAGLTEPGSAAGARVTLGLRDFWQNHPKSLIATPNALAVELWAGQSPFEWEAGLAKTHEIVLDFAKEAPRKDGVVLDPMRMTIARAWSCGSEGVGTMLPRGREAIERFPYWELMRDAAKRNAVKAMPYGMRDYGDFYYGGTYKGKNAYANLEYDVPWNFIMDFLKTEEVWLLEAAEKQARHQADVDVDHFNGRQWKHSPLHTTTEAEFGHVFVRGMLWHYLLTGERRSLEVARAVGDWMSPTVRNLEGIGNERQIGWSLYALTGLYEVTRDEKYLDTARTACLKLSEGQAATGKFKIRWDNRISFFNGIAMMGMLTVYEAAPDEQIARVILAVARRTLGFYPEYSCRTLNAFCWAAQRTNDPRYLDILEHTWRTSMDNLMGRDGGVSEEVYAWRLTWFAAKHQLLPLFDTPPEALPDPRSYRGLRLDQQRVEMYLRSAGTRPSALMVILEGLSRGSGQLTDAAGKVVRTFNFDQPHRQMQPVAFTLPPGGTTYRLQLAAETAGAWQIHYDGDTRLTLYDPKSALLPVIFPRPTGFLTESGKEVKVRLEAIGEGFHSATLYDPSGHPVAAVRHFIDLGDTNRYVIELKANVEGDSAGWGLELCGAKVLSMSGLGPYWAGDAGQLFNPERAEAPAAVEHGR